jgi:hypothetical protein
MYIINCANRTVICFCCHILSPSKRKEETISTSHLCIFRLKGFLGHVYDAHRGNRFHPHTLRQPPLPPFVSWHTHRMQDVVQFMLLLFWCLHYTMHSPTSLGYWTAVCCWYWWVSSSECCADVSSYCWWVFSSECCADVSSCCWWACTLQNAVLMLALSSECCANVSSCCWWVYTLQNALLM